MECERFCNQDLMCFLFDKSYELKVSGKIDEGGVYEDAARRISRAMGRVECKEGARKAGITNHNVLNDIQDFIQ